MPLIKLKIYVSHFVTKDFTGKFVKTILMNANPELQSIFEGKDQPTPKPIRITPLLNEGDEKPVYPRIIITRFGESSGRPRQEPKPISVGGAYNVYIGYREPLELQIALAVSRLTSGLEFDYGSSRVKVKLIEYERIDTTAPEDFNSVRVYFITPALFVDPFAKISLAESRDKARRFIPHPAVVFSVNVYDIFKDEYVRNIIRLSYALVESHTILNTVTKTWYYYDGKWLPGVIGYAKYFLRRNTPERAKRAIREILRDAMEMGVGSGRAAGFGFVKIKFG
ncbi:CRISPR system precrRNA processing endoribonuclease RAMP protein Cas6 [Vulcanisaeta sp. JCM 14467]